jgi:hypothetical protein
MRVFVVASVVGALMLAPVGFAQKIDEQAGGGLVETGKGDRVPKILVAPAMLLPNNNSIQSVGTVFRVRLDLPVVEVITYDVEVTNGVTTRTFSSAAVNSNANVDISIPYTAGLAPGDYTWRVRARSAVETGPWSGTRAFHANGGIDRLGSTTVAQFQQLKSQGWSYHFAAAWGGRNTWSSARQNLLNANTAGLKVGAYCLLNFDNSSTISGAPTDQTGDWQVDRALGAIGYNFTTGKSSLGFDLKYMVVDVETFWGTMTAQQRAQRIAQAIQRIRNLGFFPMIYTRNEGVSTWWNAFLGNATDFGDVPLWNTSPELTTNVQRDDLRVVKGATYVPFGGWAEPAGKQFLLDTTLNGLGIDLNTWNRDVWNVTSPAPGAPNLGYSVIVSLVAPDVYEAAITVTNSGTVPAYAVRISNATMGRATSTARLSLQSVAPSNGTKLGRINFTRPGNARTRCLFECTIETGYGSFPFQSMVVLPG